MKFHECYKDDSGKNARVLQRCFKKASRVFKESVKCVSRKFHKKLLHESHRSYPSRRRACYRNALKRRNKKISGRANFKGNHPIAFTCKTVYHDNKPSFCSGSCDEIYATIKLQKLHWNILENFWNFIWNLQGTHLNTIFKHP